MFKGSDISVFPVFQRGDSAFVITLSANRDVLATHSKYFRTLLRGVPMHQGALDITEEDPVEAARLIKCVIVVTTLLLHVYPNLTHSPTRATLTLTHAPHLSFSSI